MDSDDYSGTQTSRVVFRHGSSLGSSVQAAGESSSGPASSLGVRGHFHHGASSSLTLATPLQSSPNVTNHFGQTEPMFGTGGGGRSVVATNGFHSVRNADTSSRHGRRLNLRQPQEPVAFSISLGGSSVQQNILPNALSGDPLETSFTSGENQTNLVHHPALTRNIHKFAWDASSNLSGIELPQWETPRINPMFAPTTEIRNHVHDQSMWSFTRGSSTDSPFVSRARTSSAIQGKQPNPAWILPQSAPIHNNPTRASHISPWSLFPSIESQSTGHGTSLPLLPRGPPFLSSNEPYSSNTRSHRSRKRRSGLLSERHNELLHVRHLGRSLAADSDGRNHLIFEIRQVLTAMRRGKRLHGVGSTYLPGYD
ncbi:unnamed protein product [Eruca vesicaria subsp. sativa]|uniref:Uncharacterized protein n=1 Tax=Eruca vesicaria subsp. sativa TaxID=29727 RepID=A0ABC8JZG0_ERUVS|nr:unnamed protein product [Eruca vesicaria subsp. sativa]